MILLIFSFNNSQLPSFPLSGFTLHWYRQFLTNADLRAALETSAIIAAISSLGAVVLGVARLDRARPVVASEPRRPSPRCF